jgi:hypothetical protein
MSGISLSGWIENYDAGFYNNPDRETQCLAGWYDWFCEDWSLLNRLNCLAPKVKNIARSSKINTKTMYVFFKNNCPLVGELYDDFRICDIETGNVIYTISPHTGYTSNYGTAEVWGRENEFSGPIITGTMKDVYNFFGVNEIYDSPLFVEDETHNNEIVDDDEWGEDEEDYEDDELEESEEE